MNRRPFVQIMPSKGKSLFITQSNYIPWKGYFDAIHWADEFMLFDEMQFTKNDWRNRNLIKTPNGLQWLTIPVTHSSLAQKIKDTKVSDQHWRRKHWMSIQQSYRKAPFFAEYEAIFARHYLDSNEEFLSDINRSFLEAICGILSITTPFLSSSDYELHDDRVIRLVELCEARGATLYFTGPAAKNYIDLEPFKAKGIAVEFFDYSGYPEYPQLHGPFENQISALDLIFNVGQNATKYMKSFSTPAAAPLKEADGMPVKETPASQV